MKKDFSRDFLIKIYLIFYLLFSFSVCCISQTLEIHKTFKNEVIINITEASNSNVVLEERNLVNGIGWMPYFNHPLPFNVKTWPVKKLNNSNYYNLRVVGDRAERGKIISAKRLQTWNPFIINLFLVLEGINVRVSNQVEAWKIEYETVDPWGSKILASGSIFLPKTSSNKELPLLFYQHGTILVKTDAPSNNLEIESVLSGLNESLLGVIAAGNGYFTIMADYLGMGSGAGFHPYIHARSQATAAIDLSTAAIEQFPNLFINKKESFLLGYSQGGHAAMALQREIETYHTNSYKIVAAAFGAGPYDLDGVMINDLLSGRPHPNPYYFGYILKSYFETYDFPYSLNDVLRRPYDNLESVIDGENSSEVVNRYLPSIFIDALKKEFLDEFKSDMNHPLRLVIAQNNVLNWKPNSPIRLYHGTKDLNVLYENALVAKRKLEANGADKIQIIEPIKNGNHSTTVIPYLIDSLEWFESFQ